MFRMPSKAAKKLGKTGLGWRARKEQEFLLRAAELISTKHRDLLNAATMLGQSKTCHQAEIDSVL